MARDFLPYTLDQRLLLPPDMRTWLPEGHLALFVSDLVNELDLSKVYAAYKRNDDRGRAGYHPTMMVTLLVYGYAIGVRSSRSEGGARGGGESPGAGRRSEREA